MPKLTDVRFFESDKGNFQVDLSAVISIEKIFLDKCLNIELISGKELTIRYREHTDVDKDFVAIKKQMRDYRDWFNSDVKHFD